MAALAVVIECYWENNGVQILATLKSLAIKVLRLEGIWSITEGIAALAHHIKRLLHLLGWWEPAQEADLMMTSNRLCCLIRRMIRSPFAQTQQELKAPFSEH